MPQPVSANNFTFVSGAGTTVVTNRPTALYNILIPGTYIGSVEFYDSATTTGTAAGNKIFNVALPGLNQDQSINVNARCRTGLVTVATGTPTVAFTWD